MTTGERERPRIKTKAAPEQLRYRLGLRSSDAGGITQPVIEPSTPARDRSTEADGPMSHAPKMSYEQWRVVGKENLIVWISDSEVFDISPAGIPDDCV